MYCLETVAKTNADAERIESLFFRFLEAWSPTEDEELYLGTHTGPDGRVLKVRFSRRLAMDSFKAQAGAAGDWRATAA